MSRESRTWWVAWSWAAGMADLPGRVTLWCCSGCGKWSHARRRPTHHKRTIRELVDPSGEPFGVCQWYSDRPDSRTRSDPGAQAADWELPVVEEFEGGEHQIAVDDFQYDPAWVVVKCGPFVEYTAYLRAQWHEDATAKRHAEQLSGESADPLLASHYATDTVRFGPGHPPGGTRTTLEQELGGSHLPFGGDGQDIPAF